MKIANALLAAALVLTTAAAAAHDSWLAAGPVAATEGAAWLALGTGNQFPTQESGIDAPFVVRRGCRGASPATPSVKPVKPATDAAALVSTLVSTLVPTLVPTPLPTLVPTPLPTPLPTLALKALRNLPTALLLQLPRGAVTCWVQLTPFDVEVAPDKVPVYLKEIQATPEVRATWAAMQARGLPWRERYTKYARIEFGGKGPRAALPLGMDVRLDSPRAPIRAGDELGFQVLRDGAPIADLPVELVNDVNPLGIWRKTDAEGRVRVMVPLAGRWLLRSVDLRVSRKTADEWESWFVTLAFQVAAR